MKLPDFLVIGAMKCGTTTLYNDLKQSQKIFLAEKELNFLSSSAADEPDAADKYARSFRKALDGQLCGDVSTTYAMLPDVDHVVARARRLLSSTLKIIYVVREPVGRAISHHYHMSCHQGTGRMGADINVCVEQFASIINYSRYAMQLLPWREAFGDEAIKVVVFEEYVNDRPGMLQDLDRFLKLAAKSRRIDSSRIHNQSDTKPVLTRFWHRVCESPFYSQRLRPMIPAPIKHALCQLLLPLAPARPAPPSLQTIEKILHETHCDVAELTKFLGRRELLWNYAEKQKSLTAARNMVA